MAAGPGIGFGYGFVGGILIAFGLVLGGVVAAFVILFVLVVAPYFDVYGPVKLKSLASKPWFWVLFAIGISFGFFGALVVV